MILFEDDWKKYPTAIVDYDIPNKSFVHYALLLREMGIKNWMFPLALIHPELKGVDPFDPNLSREQVTLVTIESNINPWYFFRSCVLIPGSTQDLKMYFNANRSNMALFWLYLNHITVCLEQIRQTGKTFACTVLDAYLLNVRSKGGRTLLLTKDETLRAKTLTDIKTVEDLFPIYLKQHANNDIGNKEEINVSSLDNNYKGFIARNDLIAADKTGRGQTVENVRFDEAAFLFYVETAMHTILAATTAARKRAEIIDNPYGNIFTTTAGKKDDRDGAVIYKYFHDAAPWTEHLFDSKDEEELKKSIRSASRDHETLRVHCVFNHKQLGYTDEWLRETASQNNSYGEAFERDYLNIWTSGSQNSPFSIEDTKRIRNSESEILFAKISRYGQITTRCYLSDSAFHQSLMNDYTVMSVDTSDAMGRDEFAIHFRHLRTGETLASASINEINLITVSNFLVEIIETYSKLTMIIERRNQAATIIDYMHKQLINLGIDPFKRIYNTCVQDYMEFPDRYKEIQNPRNTSNENFLAQFKKFFGFTTTGTGTTARSELYGTCLQQAIKYTGDLIRDKPTIDQILSLIIKNGRIDHPKGGHDDLVVAWLLSYWFMTQGKNLQYYGIPSNYVLSHNQVLYSPQNQASLYQQYETMKAQQQLQRIINEIKQEKDPNVIDRLIYDVDAIRKQLDNTDKSELSISINEMIDKLKQEKKIKSFVKRSVF